LKKPEIILFYDNIGEKPIIKLGFDFYKKLINKLKDGPKPKAKLLEKYVNLLQQKI